METPGVNVVEHGSGSGGGGGGGDGVLEDHHHHHLTTLTPPSFITEWQTTVSRRHQYLLDKSTPHLRNRWIAFGVIAFIYILRVLIIQGFFLVSYALGIYIINLLIAFLSPQVDPEIQVVVDDSDAPTLPISSSDEFRPFVRRLPEFKLWYSITKAFCIAFVLTFFSVFDVPVFWPILFVYWLVLFFATMKKQILHMVKYKYVPFSQGKQRYGNDGSTDSLSS